MERISSALFRTASFLLASTMLLVSTRSLAAALPPELRAELTASKLVSPALVEALEHQERVAARIYVLTPTPSGAALELRRSHDGATVDPTILELAQAMLPGKLGLLHLNFLEALQGTVDARVVQLLIRNPHVISMDLDASAPEPPLVEETTFLTKALCVPTSTRACVQGGRFSLEVIISSSGAFAPVATSTSESAVFWFYSSTNWEVVAKVLNGCAINNRYWIFGAGATGTGYQLNVLDWATGRSVGYNGAALCPIADTGQLVGFPC